MYFPTFFAITFFSDGPHLDFSTGFPVGSWGLRYEERLLRADFTKDRPLGNLGSCTCFFFSKRKKQVKQKQ